MRISLLAFFLVFGIPASCQDLAPNAPPDRPVHVTNQEDLQKFEKAIAPYVLKAKSTLPDAKKKYLRGLPSGETFFVTTRIYDSEGRFEQVFVRVTSWTDTKITGTLASDTPIVDRKRGTEMSVEEQDVQDWTISKPDGSEEGNFVGKFLDSQQP